MRRHRRLENTLLVVRFLGSLISLFDIFCKISYLGKSRFSSFTVEEIYLALLFFRPLVVGSALAYNFCVGLTRICRKRNQKVKKQREDAAYQAEKGGLDEFATVPAVPRQRRQADSGYGLAKGLAWLSLSHICMVALSYSGFIRLLN